MKYCKDISSVNGSDFNELTMRYAHSSGSWKIQTTKTDSCKYDSAQLIFVNISTLRPCPEASVLGPRVVVDSHVNR